MIMQRVQRIVFFIGFAYVEYVASSQDTCNCRRTDSLPLSEPIDIICDRMYKTPTGKKCKPNKCSGSYFILSIGTNTCYCGGDLCPCANGNGQGRQPVAVTCQATRTTEEPKVPFIRSTDAQVQTTATKPNAGRVISSPSPSNRTSSRSNTNSLGDSNASLGSSNKRNITIVVGLTCGAIVVILLGIMIFVLYKEKRQRNARKMSQQIYTIPDGDVNGFSSSSAAVINRTYELNNPSIVTPSEPSEYATVNLPESRNGEYTEQGAIIRNIYSGTPLPSPPGSPQPNGRSGYAIVDPIEPPVNTIEPSGVQYSCVDTSGLRREDKDVENGDKNMVDGKYSKLQPKLVVGNMEYDRLSH